MSKKKIILLIVALLVFDQIVKIWIKTHFMLDQSVTVFPNWFFIRFIENPGAAFGFELGGNYGKLILSVFRLLAIGALGYYIFYLYRKKAPAGVLAGFSLIFAGALGNVLDSAFYGLLFSESTFTSVATFLPEGGGYAGFLHGKVVDMLFFPIVEGVFPSWIPGVGGEPFCFSARSSTSPTVTSPSASSTCCCSSVNISNNSRRSVFLCRKAVFSAYFAIFVIRRHVPVPEPKTVLS